ncbi:MAG: nrfD [Firmicutes bacterium]|nr:nrfD [Bacillota bacterium]
MEQKQEYWGVLAIGYLFLAAMGAMMFSVAAVSDLMGTKIVSQVNGWVSLIAVVAAGIGSLFLMVELTKIFKAYLVYARPSSIMCMGSYLLSSFLALGFIYATFFFDFIPWADLSLLRKAVAGLGIIASLGLVAYPGLELAEARGRTFWSGGGLVGLFLISGAATGLAGVIIVLVLFGLGYNQYTATLSASLLVVLILQFVVLTGYIRGIWLTGAVEAKKSAANILYGNYRIVFWGGVIALGTVIPLVLVLLSREPLSEVLAAVLVLFGAFCFRSIFLQAAIRIALPGEEQEVVSDREVARLAVMLEKCWEKKAAWLKK